MPEGIRCSDAEREQVRSALYAAAGEGRLTMDEVEDRLARLEQHRYRHELASLTADLPAPEPSTPEGWRQLAAAAGAAPAAEIAALRGRRRLLIALTVLIGLLTTVAFVAAALHGFGAEGFDGHDLGALDHGHGG
ncbi:DUF1707 SHOCT-like domain-containing protein [Amycolatopsis eburnea]|uniref:DUF1707 SHOCT-like domain-containing protein n=1 Tax=Amycolatopsis eburnea TaxID=2267691 RepID=UPI001CDB4EC3|nr:DUF1707 domain-containing protein [Amycolatopsis eburnea]